MSLMNIRNLTAGYGKENIVEDISFILESGEIIGVLGLNGSGKSTLIKAICNLLPHSGETVILDQALEKQKAKDIAKMISYIPQHSGITMDISVMDVVMMGFNARLKLLENPGKAMYEKAKEVLQKVGLWEKADNNYMLLSEGQKQLVILARALVSNGNVLVMDEPESALDFGVRSKMMEIARDWVREENRGGIVILHDTNLALNHCDKLILLKDKKISGIIDLKCDNIESIEEKLEKIYGNVSLIKAKGKRGKESLVMICDSEEV